MSLPSWVELRDRVPGDVVGQWSPTRWRAAVEATWIEIASSRVAQILIQEIGWTGRRLIIHPERDALTAPNAMVLPAHRPNGWRRGVNGGFDGIGTGAPDDAELEFTPGKNPRFIPGSRPRPCHFRDEVLLHELVHVLRCTHGRLDPTPCGFGFHTVDEFYAATVGNMYASERGGRALVEGHTVNVVREHRPWEGPGQSERILWEIDMLRRWRLQMPGVTGRLARLRPTVCRYNPFRIYSGYDPRWHPYGVRLEVDG